MVRKKLTASIYLRVRVHKFIYIFMNYCASTKMSFSFGGFVIVFSVVDLVAASVEAAAALVNVDVKAVG